MDAGKETLSRFLSTVHGHVVLRAHMVFRARSLHVENVGIPLVQRRRKFDLQRVHDVHHHVRNGRHAVVLARHLLVVSALPDGEGGGGLKNCNKNC